MVVVASVLASWVQNSWGRVRVTGITLPTQNGQWVSADLFRPVSATADNPAPLVVVVPGFQRAKETQANISLELARRGIVVIAIDPYSQGSSSSSTNQRSATNEGYGMFAVVNYAANTDNLNYIDKARIGVTGHSAGGNAAIQGAAYFGAEARKAGGPSKIQSVFVSGYVLTLTEKTLRPVRSNVGISYALFDEGAYRNENKNGDMRRAPEALRLVRSGLGATEPIEEVEIGRYYGDVAARTLDLLQDAPCVLEQALAGLSGHGAAAVARQQRLPQFHLETADLPADGRLGDAERPGGAGEAAQVDDADEILELLEVHDALESQGSAHAKAA